MSHPPPSPTHVRITNMGFAVNIPANVRNTNIGLLLPP
jgi:hypothetical protein